MPDRVCLVYLETSGNQAFIFGTNKLRENIGASEAVLRAGTELVAQALEHAFPGLGMPSEPEAQARWIIEQPAIEESASLGVEVVVATSGKALLLVRHEHGASAFVTAWSRRVLTDAPGVDAAAVFSEPFALSSLCDGVPGAVWAMRQVHERFERARSTRRSLETRFGRLPLVDACASSGLPAEHLYRESKEGRLLSGSEVTLAKRRRALQARSRLQGLLGERLAGAVDLNELDKHWNPAWIGVVHADGNGLGEIFLKLDQHVEKLYPDQEPAQRSRTFLRVYRDLSHRLDGVTRRAFQAALGTFVDEMSYLRERNPRKTGWRCPILPIVVGGDDLTVLCDGRFAIRFASELISAFERYSGEDEVLKEVAKVALSAPRLGMTAGVSIIKPGFPFFTAYGIAEDLLRSAKTVKEHAGPACSALDFHVVYDGSVSTLDAIRKRLEVHGRRLHSGPFVTTPAGEGQTWARVHAFAHLEAGVEALRQPSHADERRSALPASQAHAVRAALHRDPAEADALLQHLAERYHSDGFDWPDKSLFVADHDGVLMTRFQDALEAKAFLCGRQSLRGDTP